MNYEQIKEAVEANGDLKTFPMEVLRDAHGVGRLGPVVCPAISSKLAGMGLSHLPKELPRYQNELVRIYKNGTPVGDLIATVLNPGEQNDDKLRERFAGDGIDYAGIVEQIRELVQD